MIPLRNMVSVLAASALAMSAIPAHAKANPGAAHKLALTGAQGASGCIAKPGEKGAWRRDVHGNWLPCKAVSRLGDDDGDSSWLWIAGGVIAAGVLIYVLVDNGDDSPSSP